MTQLIIIEGADRCGKTSIASQVAYKLGAHYYHFGKPDCNLQKVYGHHYQYTEMVDQWALEDFVVLDRSWVSGLFYDFHRRFTSYPEYQSETEKLLQYLESYLIKPQLYVTYRPWDSKLCQDHMVEITTQQDAIPATLCERALEHYSWPGFTVNYPYMDLIQFIDYSEDSINLVTQNAKAAAAYRYIRRNSPAISGMDSNPDRQAILNRFANFWSAYNWENNDVFRAGNLLSSIPDCNPDNPEEGSW